MLAQTQVRSDERIAQGTTGGGCGRKAPMDEELTPSGIPGDQVCDKTNGLCTIPSVANSRHGWTSERPTPGGTALSGWASVVFARGASEDRQPETRKLYGRTIRPGGRGGRHRRESGHVVIKAIREHPEKLARNNGTLLRKPRFLHADQTCAGSCRIFWKSRFRIRDEIACLRFASATASPFPCDNISFSFPRAAKDY